MPHGRRTGPANFPSWKEPDLPHRRPSTRRPRSEAGVAVVIVIRTAAAQSHVNKLWQSYLRRFDLERTPPAVQAGPWRDQPPAAANRWTWLIIAATFNAGGVVKRKLTTWRS